LKVAPSVADPVGEGLDLHQGKGPVGAAFCAPVPEISRMRDTPMRLPTLVATLSFSGAALSAEMAWLHARSLHLVDAFCGVSPTAPHCGWCVSAAALALTGAAALILGRRDSRAAQAAPARRGRP
jgi:hypothetical protein